MGWGDISPSSKLKTEEASPAVFLSFSFKCRLLGPSWRLINGDVSFIPAVIMQSWTARDLSSTDPLCMTHSPLGPLKPAMKGAGELCVWTDQSQVMFVNIVRVSLCAHSDRRTGCQVLPLAFKWFSSLLVRELWVEYNGVKWQMKSLPARRKGSFPALLAVSAQRAYLSVYHAGNHVEKIICFKKTCT